MNATEPTLGASALHPAISSGTCLAPAQVVVDHGDSLEIAFPDQRTTAVKAIYPAYQAIPGDTVLVIGETSGPFYAIAVIQSQQPATLQVNGDLRLQARGGRIKLESDVGVEVRSQHVLIQALRLETLASTAKQTFQQLSQWVAGKCSLAAKQSVTQVEEESSLVAGKISAKARGDVQIDGNRINLG